MPTPLPPRRRRFLTGRRVLLALVAIGLMAVVAGYISLAMNTGRMLRSAVADADRLDPGWTRPDLEARRATPPDSENSAAVIARVATRMPTSWPPIPRVASSNNRTGTQAGEDVLTRVRAIPIEVRLPGFLAAELRNELERLGDALAEARTLSEKPRGRFAIQYNPNPIMTLLPHAQWVRNLARVLEGDAIARAHDGDIDGALDSCRAMLNCGRSIGDEPFLISQLVRVACGTMAAKTIERVLAQGIPSEAALAKVQALLAEEAKFSILLAGLRGERAWSNELMTKLTTGELDMGSVNAGVGTSLPTRLPFSGSFYQYNHALMLGNLNAAVEVARKPDPEHLAAWAELEKRIHPPDGMIVRAFGALSQLLLPAMLSVGEAHLRYRATLGSALAIVAVERHRIAHGARPGSFDAIDPKFAEGLIGDPYVGGPLKFKPEAERLLVYSVNQDGKDDGGKMDVRRRPSPGTDWGLFWWNPDARRKPSPIELPPNVFQAPSRGDQGEPIQ